MLTILAFKPYTVKMQLPGSSIPSRSLKIYLLFAILGSIATAALLVIDKRMLSGEPLWLKPLKFFLSSGIMVATVEWIFSRSASPSLKLDRCRQAVAWGLFFEMAVICTQATRGVKSHFNYESSFDAALFVLMGLVVTGVVIAAAWGTFRATGADSRMSQGERSAARWGMTIFVLAAFLGNAMARPTPSQMEVLRAGKIPNTMGSHFVGSEEGSTQTLPLTGWSQESGDLRIAHFFGMHAIQILILMTLAMRRRSIPLNSPQVTRGIRNLGLILGAIWMQLLVIALLGRSILNPGLILGLPLIALVSASMGWVAFLLLRSDRRENL